MGQNNSASLDNRPVHYWLYSPGDNATRWNEFRKDGIMAIGWDEIGDLSQYRSKEAMKQKMRELIDPNSSFKNAGHATWQFANEIQPGDIVFAKKGMSRIIGRGVVVSGYSFDGGRKNMKNVLHVKWAEPVDFPHPDGRAAMKTLTDITAYTGYVAKLNALFESEDQEDINSDPAEVYEPYDRDAFLNDVYISEFDYDTLTGLLKAKKNIILQGPPGAGKTYAAKRIAYSIIGSKDQGKVKMIQFHQSYSYEDFIMGFRPEKGGGFKVKEGPFYTFCKEAEKGSEDDHYFFIIDEINRGNISKIFGELFMLIESDKRGSLNGLPLLYEEENFSVPENVYIIGMMNTADRSLAMLDYALRRRFAFFDMKPGFDSDGFRKYQEELGSACFDKLIKTIMNLNSRIASDDSLGEGFCIGHSYLCNLDRDNVDSRLPSIVEYELIPMIREYWFDDKGEVDEWSKKLRDAVK